jgi:uncharacterized LabA/DUF88 family protein
MKKTAILIDGEFFSIALRHDLKLKRRPNAKEIYEHAFRLADVLTEEVWRIFFYDSRPYTGVQRHPVTKRDIPFAHTSMAKARDAFLDDLGQMDLVALRCGKAQPRGWRLSEAYLRQIGHGQMRPPDPEDYELRFEQKGVDMRIGIDVATLALNHHVERIIVATNDTDLIPALKVARRCGIQVVLAHIGSFVPHHDLVEDADFKRHYAVAA